MADRRRHVTRGLGRAEGEGLLASARRRRARLSRPRGADDHRQAGADRQAMTATAAPPESFGTLAQSHAPRRASAGVPARQPRRRLRHSGRGRAPVRPGRGWLEDRGDEPRGTTAHQCGWADRRVRLLAGRRCRKALRFRSTAIGCASPKPNSRFVWPGLCRIGPRPSPRGGPGGGRVAASGD